MGGRLDGLASQKDIGWLFVFFFGECFFVGDGARVLVVFKVVEEEVNR